MNHTVPTASDLAPPQHKMLCISTQIYHIPFNGYKSIWYQSFNNCSLE